VARGPRPARRLLVVDDEPDIVRILVTIARDRGYDAAGAMELEEVLRYVRATPPEVVLLDLNMPLIDGRDLLARITAGPDAPAVIVMSGWVDDLTLEVCRRYGAADVVRKPLQPDDLFRRIDAAVAMR
jgi:CheY-like chemotaxis protein